MKNSYSSKGFSKKEKDYSKRNRSYAFHPDEEEITLFTPHDQVVKDILAYSKALDISNSKNIDEISLVLN